MTLQSWIPQAEKQFNPGNGATYFFLREYTFEYSMPGSFFICKIHRKGILVRNFMDMDFGVVLDRVGEFVKEAIKSSLSSQTQATITNSMWPDTAVGSNQAATGSKEQSSE